MGKILVKGPQIQMGRDGPQLFYDVGVSGRRRGGDGVRGSTKRGKAAALAGGAVGVLGGLAGESRSLGGLLSNVQVGAMQGSAVGRGLAGMATSRRRQARADLVEGRNQAQVKGDAEAQLRGEQELKRRRNVLGETGAYEYQQGEPVSPMGRTLLGRLSGRDMTRFGHELAGYNSQQEAIANQRAQQQKELDKQGFKGSVADWMKIQANLPDKQNLTAVQRLAASGQVPTPTLGQQMPAAPVQQMAPVGPLPASDPKSAAAQVQVGDSNDHAAHLGQLGDTDNEITPDQQGQQGQQGQEGEEGGKEDQSTVRSGPGFGREGVEGMDDRLFNTSGGRQ